LEFSAHHAGVDLEAVGLLHPVAQLFQSDIRLSGNFGPQPSFHRCQSAGAAAGMGPGGATAGFPQATAQPFDKALAHTEPLGDGPLRRVASGQRISNPFT
jgi:hypothetical protein